MTEVISCGRITCRNHNEDGTCKKEKVTNDKWGFCNDLDVDEAKIPKATTLPIDEYIEKKRKTDGVNKFLKG